jgi:hypothetical protein
MKYYLILHCLECRDTKKIEVNIKAFQRSSHSSRTVGGECLKDAYDYCERCESKGARRVPTCCGGIKVEAGSRCPTCGDIM